MTMVGLPLILVQVGGVKKTLSDIEYLAIKEFDNKRVDVFAEIDQATIAVTDLVTQTANVGKDMYLAKASIVWNKTGATNAGITARLFINGVKEDEVLWSTGTLTTQQEQYIFTTESIKVLTGQIIKIEVLSDSANDVINYKGKLLLWEEDTGTTPAIT